MVPIGHVVVNMQGHRGAHRGREDVPLHPLEAIPPPPGPQLVPVRGVIMVPENALIRQIVPEQGHRAVLRVGEDVTRDPLVFVGVVAI